MSGRVCDFADPAARIDFEVDGAACHRGAALVARDGYRFRGLLASGWLSFRSVTTYIRKRPAATLADARGQIARRSS